MNRRHLFALRELGIACAIFSASSPTVAQIVFKDALFPPGVEIGRFSFDGRNDLISPGGVAVHVDVAPLDPVAGYRDSGVFFNVVVVDRSADLLGRVSLARETPGFIREDCSFGALDVVAESGSADGEVNFPMHVVFDDNGQLFVADFVNSRVQKFDSQGNFVEVLPGTISGPGDVSSPFGVAVDQDGHIYVSEFATINSRINKYDAAGNFIATIVGPGMDPGQVNDPTGLAFQPDLEGGGRLYVADGGNGRVQVFDQDGNFRFPIPLVGPSPFSSPRGVAVDPFTTEVYISDSSLDKIFRLDFSGALQEFAEFGTVENPRQLTFDKIGNLYVTDSNGSGRDRVLMGRREVSKARLQTLAQLVVSDGVKFYNSQRGDEFRMEAAQAILTAVGQSSLSAFSDLSELFRQQIGTNLANDPAGQNVRGKALADMVQFVELLHSLPGPREPICGDIPDAPRPDPEACHTVWCIDDPFYGRFESDTPVGFPLPPSVTYRLDPATASANVLQNSPTFGSMLVQPEVLGSEITVAINGLDIQVTDFNTQLGSFELFGQQTGVNNGFLHSGAQVHTEFDGLTEFEAHAEGRMTNDLYPAARPIFAFVDLEGFVYAAIGRDDAIAWGVNEPMIAPGPPGGPPTELLADAYIAVRAEFDPTQGPLGSVIFHENTDPANLPDVSLVLTPQDVFAAELPGEPVIGASVSIDPFQLTGENADGDFEFADAAFAIFNSSGTFASGLFTDVTLDPVTGAFSAAVSFDALANALASPFIAAWTSNASRGNLQLLGPRKARELVALSDNFIAAAMTNTTLMRIAVVPEPGAWSLAALGLLSGLHARRRTTGERPNESRP